MDGVVRSYEWLVVNDAVGERVAVDLWKIGYEEAEPRFLLRKVPVAGPA